MTRDLASLISSRLDSTKGKGNGREGGTISMDNEMVTS